MSEAAPNLVVWRSVGLCQGCGLPDAFLIGFREVGWETPITSRCRHCFEVARPAADLAEFLLDTLFGR